MNRRHWMPSLVATASTALLLAGCGGGGYSSGASAKPSGSSSPTQVAAAGSSAVEITNFKFSPASITVKKGARVDVTNDDSVTHTVTADDGNSFDTGDLADGASKTISVSKPGTYAFHCTIHPYMHGTLVVK